MRLFSSDHAIVGGWGAGRQQDVVRRSRGVSSDQLSPFPPATARVGGFLRGDLSAPAAASRIYKAFLTGCSARVRVPDAPKTSGRHQATYDAAQALAVAADLLGRRRRTASRTSCARKCRCGAGFGFDAVAGHDALVGSTHRRRPRSL